MIAMLNAIATVAKNLKRMFSSSSPGESSQDRSLVICRQDLDAAVAQLNRDPHGRSGSMPVIWSRKFVLELVEEAIARHPNDRFFYCGSSILAERAPAGRDLAYYASDPAEQIYLHIRGTATVPEDFVMVRRKSAYNLVDPRPLTLANLAQSRQTKTNRKHSAADAP